MNKTDNVHDKTSIYYSGYTPGCRIAVPHSDISRYNFLHSTVTCGKELNKFFLQYMNSITYMP